MKPVKMWAVLKGKRVESVTRYKDIAQDIVMSQKPRDRKNWTIRRVLVTPANEGE